MKQDPLTLKEMAAKLKVSARTFRQSVDELGIPYIPVGKRMRFNPDAVMAFLTVTQPAKPKNNVVKFSDRPSRKKNRIIASQRFADA